MEKLNLALMASIGISGFMCLYFGLVSLIGGGRGGSK